jgi:hypothetical protein
MLVYVSIARSYYIVGEPVSGAYYGRSQKGMERKGNSEKELEVYESI